MIEKETILPPYIPFFFFLRIVQNKAATLGAVIIMTSQMTIWTQFALFLAALDTLDCYEEKKITCIKVL